MFTFTATSLFFGGLAAAGIPVVLHFLMQGKPKRIEFPAVMFLVRKIETHRRNFRLKYLLLLALRILLFVLMGLALARPVFKTGWLAGAVGGSRDAPIAAAVVIDTSIRMNYIAENKTRLDAAKEAAGKILHQIPQNSSIAIFSGEAEAAVFQVDSRAAEQKINRLKITPVPSGEAGGLRAPLSAAAALLKESPLDQKELYVISDMSAPGWEGESIGKNSERTSAIWDGIGIFIVDVGAEKPQNSAIQKISIIPETLTAGAPVRFDIQTARFGSASSQTVELILLGKSGDPKAETVRMTKTVNFSEGESQQTVSMTLTGFDAGLQQGKIRFAVSDALPADDQGWFTLHVAPPQKVRIFAQPPVHDSALYFRQALETVPFTVSTAPLTELAGMTQTELQEYQGVMLLDPSPLPPAVWKKLADYAAAGFGVGTVLGPHADSLESFNHAAATEVLGAKLVRQARNPDGECWMLPGVSPVFTPFRSIQPLDEFPWNALPVYRYWETGDVPPRADAAAHFSDRRPAIMTQTIGRGRTFTLMTDMSGGRDGSRPLSVWNDWTRGETAWMFVLLAEGLGKYLTGMGEQKFNYIAGEPVVLRPNTPALPPSCLLGTPQGQSVRLTPDAVRREITIPQTTEPGNYQVRSGGIGQQALNLGFSVNLPAGSTNLRKTETATLDKHFGQGRYQLTDGRQADGMLTLRLERRRIGQELYTAVVLLLACLFGIEYVLANRIYGK
ncbi:MAG: BatA and WFA domain-containing protein [Planctomycetaceae bacterium]|jgi:hypothetical protein|nr:BatA and WFA domain-containing protein [Planctomycetaceae bacterium]